MHAPPPPPPLPSPLECEECCRFGHIPTHTVKRPRYLNLSFTPVHPNTICTAHPQTTHKHTNTLRRTYSYSYACTSAHTRTRHQWVSARQRSLLHPAQTTPPPQGPASPSPLVAPHRTLHIALLAAVCSPPQIQTSHLPAARLSTRLVPDRTSHQTFHCIDAVRVGVRTRSRIYCINSMQRGKH
jgi:hypothetical protein